MRAKLSVIIPTLEAGALLPACLVALMEGIEAGLIRELVISDGGSTDATRALAEEAGAIWVAGPPGRGGQLARGVAASGGDWLLVLHADSVLDPGWSAAVEAGMARGVPGYFPLRFDARGLAPAWVAGWANLRARVLGLPFGDQGLLVSRAAYDAAGGYREIPLMEDVALVRALPRPRVLPGRLVTGWNRYRGRWFAQGLGNLVRQLRFFAGADPARLARGYGRD